MTTDSPVQPRRAALEMAEASDIGLPQTAWPDLATPSTSGFDYLQENTADQIAHHDGDVHLERLTIAPAERVSPESVERVLESLSRSSAVTSLRESLPQDSRVAQVRQWTSNHLRLILSVLAIGVVVSVWTFISSRPQTHTVINESSSASPFQAGGENPESNQGRTGTTPAGVSTAPNPSSPPPPVQVRVHVLGAVANPGVVTLPQGSRVDDAIVAAGGLTASADPKDLNLAAIVEDGNQVIIGTTANPRGELVRAGQAPASGGDAPLPSVIQINLNTASQAQLETLPGVGPVLAAEIITYRSGTPFSAVSELRNVKGIGNKLYERLAPLVTV